MSDVTAGQTVPVTLGATVGFDNQGTPGTVSLPGTSVTGVPIISVTPASQTAQPGGTATYDVRLENPTDASVTYSLGVLGTPGYGERARHRHGRRRRDRGRAPDDHAWRVRLAGR